MNVHRANAASGKTTNRDEASYRILFNVEPHERVLDLGSGGTQFNTLHNVVQLDCAYTEPSSRPPQPRNAVAALYQNLPFRDDAFDRVTCRYGNLTLNNEGAIEAVSEAVRVTRPNGLIQIYPVENGSWAKQEIALLQFPEDYAVWMDSRWRAVRAELANANFPLLRKLAGGLGALAFFQPLTIRKTDILQTKAFREHLASRVGPLINRITIL